MSFSIYHITLSYLVHPATLTLRPCERMHKEIAKRPGRRAQKQHERFTFQAAQRLADRHVLDKAYHDIVRDYELPESDEENSNSYEMMTSFYMHLLLGNKPCARRNLSHSRC